MSQAKPVTALIPIADGSEEIEALSLIDVLLRGGIQVTTASVGQKPNNTVTMAHGVKVQADVAIEACADRNFDAIFVPGGMPGATNLSACEPLINMLAQHKRESKWYGAICASPAVVLHKHGLCPSPATCYPSFEKDLQGIDVRSNERVVVTGKCITSRGPGTAMEMGVKIVEVLCGREKATEVAEGMLMKH